ncbi:MAG: 16S rRNA (uracil(1498)-N(3))-methyltransferase [Methylocella sp.]
MSCYDFAARRLYVNPPLAQAAQIALDQAQVNYVRNVLRLSEGMRILVFNGRDGEWETSVATSKRKQVTLAVDKLIRPQEPPPDLHYLFSPIKQARQDYMIEKAVEMGAGLLRPVLTSRTQARRINSERMRAHAIEAAEQCGILSIPEIAPPTRLEALLGAWEQNRLLIFCDEDAPCSDPLAALRPRADAKGTPALAVLIGPEGGFDAREREALLGLPCVLRLPLGPRILRADTAAVAALALVQATLGDWRR